MGVDNYAYLTHTINMPNKHGSFNLRMPPNLKSRLEALATEKELTLTALILEVLRQHLENLGK